MREFGGVQEPRVIVEENGGAGGEIVGEQARCENQREKDAQDVEERDYPGIGVFEVLVSFDGGFGW